MATVSKGAAAALVAAALGCWAIAAAAQSSDPLPSWNDGPAKQAIVEFVEAVTTEGGADFVPPEDRIATFDQDGTLWVEHPLYSQAMFALDRRGRAGRRASGVEDQGAVQGGARGRPRGDGQVHRGGLGGDHRRHPRRDDHRGVPRDRRGVARQGQASALQAAVHRAGLPADARGDGATCAPTAFGPTSSPAAARSSCASTASGSTAFRPSR